jgi:hypothetical protein
LRNSRKTPRLAAALALAVGMLLAFAALGGVGLAQTAGGPGGKQYGKNKVEICHKGKRTIRVPQPAVKAHLKHGDTLGSCSSAAAKAKKAKAAKAKAQKAKAEKAKAEKAKAEKAKESGENPGKGKGGKGKGGKG